MATQEESKQFHEKLQQAKQEIAAKSFSDSQFRAQLIADPRGTIEKEYGLSEGTLSGVTFNVVEEQSGEIVLPIPDAEIELSEDQLELVAGGALFIGIIGLVGSVAVAAKVGATAGVEAGW